MRASALRLVRRFSGGPAASHEFYVSNLPFKMTVVELRAAFERVCSVQSVVLPTDSSTGLSRGFAFVTVEGSADDVVSELHGSTFHDRIVTVKRKVDSAMKTNAEIAKAKAQRAAVQAATDGDVSASTAGADTVGLDAAGAAVADAAVADAAGAEAAESEASVVSPAFAAEAKRRCIALNKELVLCPAVKDILGLFERKGGESYDAVNLATSLHRVGVLHSTLLASQGPALQRLVDCAATHVLNDPAAWAARQLSVACWGVAKVRDVDARRLFDAIANAARPKVPTFSSQELANTAWAFTKLRVEAPGLFDAIATTSVKKMDTFNAQDLANTAWAFSTAGIRPGALFHAIAHDAPKKLDKFNPQALANIIWAFATAGVHAPGLFKAVGYDAVKKILLFAPQNLVNISWAYAMADVEAPAKSGEEIQRDESRREIRRFLAALFKAVAAEARSKILANPQSWNPQALSNLVWAYARAGVSAPALFDAVAAESEKKLSTFIPLALANMLWAFSKSEAHFSNKKLFDAIAPEALRNVEAMPARGLADTAWAYGKAGFEAPELLRAIAVETISKIDRFNSESLANVAWGVAKAGVHSPALFEAVTAEVSKKITTFDSQDLADTAWALATAGISAPEVMEELASRSQRKVKSSTPQNLVDTYFAYGRMGLDLPQLYDAVAEESLQKIQHFSARNLLDMAVAHSESGHLHFKIMETLGFEMPKKFEMYSSHDLARAAKAFGVARMHAPQFFNALVQRVLVLDATQFGSLKDVAPSDVADMIWAFAYLGIEAKQLFAAANIELAAHVNELSQTDLVNVVWAYSAVRQRKASLFSKIAAALDVESLTVSQQAQLHLVFVFLQGDTIQDDALLAVLRPMAANLQQAHVSRSQAHVSDGFRQEVSAALTRIRWEHDFECQLAQGIFVDAAQQSSKIAVQADGPERYMHASQEYNAPECLDGEAHFKHRTLKAMGWQLCRIPYSEWIKLENEAQQEGFLRYRIQDLQYEFNVKWAPDGRQGLQVEHGAPMGS